MNDFCDDPKVWFELTNRILYDHVPVEPLPAAYLFGETYDNRDSVIQRGAQILREGKVELLINSSWVHTNHPLWGVHWREALVDEGVDESKLIQIEPSMLYRSPEGNITTGSETEALLLYLKEHKISKVALVAPPFHQVRAFVTFISTLYNHHEEKNIKAYSIPGTPLDWNQEALHSQFVVHGKRHEFLAGEFERLNQYCRDGQLVSAQHILEYLNQLW